MELDLKELRGSVDSLSEDKQLEVLDLLDELEEAKNREIAHDGFMGYVDYIWPDFIPGSHHHVVADAFDRVISGELKRLVIAIAPRHTKSQFGSHYLPSYFLGKFPKKQVIQCSNMGELAVGFGREVRDTVDSPEYKKIFPGVGLKSDSKAAGRWATNQGGKYFAVGVSGIVTGLGADLLIIDDPHALHVDTEIPTPNGFVRIADLRVGDYVYGPDGKPTKVVAKSDVMRDRPIYSAKTSDGEEVLCDGGHLWSYREGVDPDAPLLTTTARELVDSLVRLPKSARHKDPRYLSVTLTNDVGDVQCITVYREDGLFLAGRGYVVTHNSEQEAALANPVSVYDKAYEWYTSGPRQRLQPGGATIIIATRWHKKDLVGQILKKAKQTGEKWEVIELPAIVEIEDAPEDAKDEEKYRSLWPEYWPIKELLALKKELPAAKWNAQYMQNPTAEEGALIRRKWWKRWEKDSPPKCEFIIQAWDTAYSAKESADFSACSTWGIFRNEDGVPNIILLNAFKGRWNFPDLKERAYREYMMWKPDSCVIEAKASGTPLIAELQRRGLIISDFTPTRGNDKHSRVNSVADMFSSGIVWAPRTDWADELIEEFAEFPFGEHDDSLDAGVLALMRFRQGGYIPLPSDWDDEEEQSLSYRRKRAYY